ncbi:E1-like protein-activating [Coprinopsis marcescibilis]|uniref:Ubiquitin-like modifier-activating enzyme ATG7 n=1 Tax=Coprinopsis marcescibilis TaxID=230819 RepID=A0A5C3KMQ1_COPMA|nr:E1-like protein-activating [Coprinopsis marcescibilis]
MPILQFAPFSSVVSPAFWHKLTDLKIDVLRLDDAPVGISGSYGPGRSVHDRETGQDIVMNASFSVDGESFAGGADTAAGQHGATRTVYATGSFKNFNTIEEFKNADKNKLFNDEAQEIWQSIVASRSAKQLTRFFLISYADLKKYKYYYWFAFPAFVSKPAWEIEADGWKNVRTVFSADQLASIDGQVHADRQFFVVSKQGKVGAIEEYEAFFASVPAHERIVGFIDPSADPVNPGWPLRNLLAYLRALYPAHTTSVQVLRWRDLTSSQLGTVSLPAPLPSTTTDRPSAVGWERNPQGKLGARVADLAPMMDPTRLAAQAVDLNLKLMRWRILPALDLEKVSGARCLLLGAGTLGCYVARSLMGWGVRTITLVDSSRVSFSNPVRQPLFEFEDCLDGGKPKAECAAERLKKIYPGINATGHTLSIPMPGHPISPTNPTALAEAKASVRKLEELVESHDAVFLLMDSRESRWLPTVLGASRGKIVINAALGFDTFLVMRHGVRARDVKEGGRRLGCYYCNDIVAPSDSLTDRTLDQMCTVTRPGLAPIAAATAVELLTSILQHPEGNHASPPAPNSDLHPTQSYAEQGESVLGVVPHQIRGFLAQFRNLNLVGDGFGRCTGCSEAVLEAYEKDGFGMLLEAFNDQGYLERLSGLDELAKEGEAALEAVEWDEEADDF